MIELNDLLEKNGLDPQKGMVIRHRPTQPELRKALPWLAAEDPDVYNAYQRDHHETVERALGRAAYVVSLIGHEPGKALFVGVYRIDGWKVITGKKWASLELSKRLMQLGLEPPAPMRRLRLFDLTCTEQLADCKGRLVVSWPPPERSWWRWASRNRMQVDAIHPESILVKQTPSWNEMVLTWVQLQSLPRDWKAAMAQWRGVYFIRDGVTGKGYVGSAYGRENILARWLAYARTGHGGNVDLKGLDPRNFTFAVLQRVAPDAPPEEVIRIESNWKDRLGTRRFGLNRN